MFIKPYFFAVSQTLASLVFLLVGLMLFSCSHQKTTMVGGQKDKHGCYTAAGYQWSELKKDCIRPFELPNQLSDSSNQYKASFFTDEDQRVAEVFCKEGHFMLQKNASGKYVSPKSKQKTTLSFSAGKWILKDSAKSIYYSGN
jgi:hypothetical protein